VEKGFTQKYNITFEEIFAPIAWMENVRLVLSLATNKRWTVYHIDVKSIFLNGYLNEEVYVEKP